MVALSSVPALYRYKKPTISHTTVALVWSDVLLRVYGTRCPLSLEQAVHQVAFIEVPLRGNALEAGYLDGTMHGELYRVFLLRTREGQLMHCCLPQPLCNLDPWRGLPLHLEGFLDQRHLLPLFVARTCHPEAMLV